MVKKLKIITFSLVSRMEKNHKFIRYFCINTGDYFFSVRDFASEYISVEHPV